jgi:hypothetical protein
MRASLRRGAALLVSIGSMIALAFAGGAGFRGW